jgi:Fic-DOC domain mobile mystery protein B
MEHISEVEGITPLDPDELAGLRHPHVTTRGQLDHLEQANIQEGLKWLQRRRNRNDVLQERFVRELHKKLFGEVWSWAGTFRTTEKNIGIDPRQIAVQLRLLLGDAAYWIEKKTYDPKEIALRLHHRLVYIHPFPNGNGRHARIMADTVLTEVLRQEPINWNSGHTPQEMNVHRAAYITALRQADQGDYMPLRVFVGLKR